MAVTRDCGERWLSLTRAPMGWASNGTNVSWFRALCVEREVLLLLLLLLLLAW